MFYINIKHGKINGGSEHNNSRFWTDDYFQLEVTEDEYNAIISEQDKYLYDAKTNSITENLEYESEQAEKAKLIHIEEIKAQLNAIDIKTIRALRAGEIEYLNQYEAQAIELRQQLKDLGVSDDSELD